MREVREIISRGSEGPHPRLLSTETSALFDLLSPLGTKLPRTQLQLSQLPLLCRGEQRKRERERENSRWGEPQLGHLNIASAMQIFSVLSEPPPPPRRRRRPRPPPPAAAAGTSWLLLLLALAEVFRPAAAQQHFDYQHFAPGSLYSSGGIHRQSVVDVARQGIVADPV